MAYVITKSSPTTNAAVPSDFVAESTHATEDAAYEHAMSVGGDRYVTAILRGVPARFGVSEYVESVQS